MIILISITFLDLALLCALLKDLIFKIADLNRLLRQILCFYGKGKRQNTKGTD